LEEKFRFHPIVEKTWMTLWVVVGCDIYFVFALLVHLSSSPLLHSHSHTTHRQSYNPTITKTSHQQTDSYSRPYLRTNLHPIFTHKRSKWALLCLAYVDRPPRILRDDNLIWEDYPMNPHDTTPTKPHHHRSISIQTPSLPNSNQTHIKALRITFLTCSKNRSKTSSAPSAAP